ncbi:MAG TPA: hypothetical protein VK431_02010, partial [Nitrosopumilaceae archaeon]|nr:hypothetical protein [Nitrosopumilaceae archaeon]
MNKVLILPIFALLVFALPVSIQNAHATGFELQVGDGNGACEALGGTWDGGTNTCTVFSLTINSGDTLTIDSGVILAMSGGSGGSGGSAG